MGLRRSAIFRPGASALGHHWVVRDGDGTEVGRTKLFHEGSTTDISTNDTIRAIVLDGSGAQTFRLVSVPKNDTRVEVSRVDGTLLGVARRRRQSLELEAADSRPVGIVRPSDEGFTVETETGDVIGVLSPRQLETHGTAIETVAGLADLTSTSASFSATMHLGLASSREYHLTLDVHPQDPALATLAELAPLLAAYSY